MKVTISDHGMLRVEFGSELSRCDIMRIMLFVVTAVFTRGDPWRRTFDPKLMLRHWSRGNGKLMLHPFISAGDRCDTYATVVVDGMTATVDYHRDGTVLDEAEFARFTAELKRVLREYTTQPD